MKAKELIDLGFRIEDLFPGDLPGGKNAYILVTCCLCGISCTAAE